jgi:diguanylate cyclase (GGDEF)-like protein/putative nucleotidyltransferase with HDIG domain
LWRASAHQKMTMSFKARAYWSATILTGTVLVAAVLSGWDFTHENLPKLGLYLAAAVLTSRLKVRLPGVFGTLSMNYVFMFLALLELQLGSAVVIALAGILAQTLLFPKQKPLWEQVLFSVLGIVLPILATGFVLGLAYFKSLDRTGVVAVLCASTTYFLLNTGTVSTMIGWSSDKMPFEVWRESFLWTAPQYLVGGSIAAALHLLNNSIPWQVFLFSAPPIYLIYTSYTQYLGHVDEQQKHIADMARLHWRTIEALALAIQAKDETTASHLRRVQVYATEVARELQLSPSEMKAIEAAAILHDIGKLAVPEYIISKPGKLTREEFEKMKIHPVVGAEILERVDFPYPVVPIVRSHHEKFDGSGYPDGLKGEDIPIGARVIAAVDCLDALASHRQYRPALPLDDAMQFLIGESGRSFDPRIVEILARKYRELESKATADSVCEPRTSQEIQQKNTSAPAAGFASAGGEGDQPSGESFTLAIASARREFQLLIDDTSDLGASLTPEETLALLAVRLEACVPHDTIVIYISTAGHLKPQFVKGESFRLFSSLSIPVGQGLSGWVAENNLPIVNGNPAVEPGYLNDPHRITSLRSGISVPLLRNNEVVGVLSLYSLLPEAFNQDHLRILLSIQTRAGILIANLLRFKELQSAAETDELTGLSNAGTLFRVLAQEISQARQSASPLAVVVLDLDGFKDANDRYGHLAGNRILQKIASELTHLCRRTDHVARLGGDEFVVILNDVTESRLAVFLEQLEEVGPRASMQICHEQIITISAGAAWYPDNGSNAEILLDAADRQMYEVKRAKKLLLTDQMAPEPSFV